MGSNTPSSTNGKPGNKVKNNWIIQLKELKIGISFQSGTSARRIPSTRKTNKEGIDLSEVRQHDNPNVWIATIQRKIKSDSLHVANNNDFFIFMMYTMVHSLSDRKILGKGSFEEYWGEYLYGELIKYSWFSLCKHKK